jgi:hypothetical protein
MARLIDQLDVVRYDLSAIDRSSVKGVQLFLAKPSHPFQMLAPATVRLNLASILLPSSPLIR